jgi:uncharacterized protein (DUF1499 family)
MKKMLNVFLPALLLLPLLVLLCGQLGLLAGRTPEGLGVHDGKLKAPRSTPNSVSSQARAHPTHPRHLEAQIEPFAYQGDGPAALKRLAALVAGQPRTRLVRQDTNYLYFECSTRWLKFTDDLEFLLDEGTKVIHVRSASRLGRRDFDVNRERVESIRKLFAA